MKRVLIILAALLAFGCGDGTEQQELLQVKVVACWVRNDEPGLVMLTVETGGAGEDRVNKAVRR